MGVHGEYEHLVDIVYSTERAAGTERDDETHEEES